MALPEQVLCEGVAQAILDAGAVAPGQAVVGRRPVPLPATVLAGYVQIQPRARIPDQGLAGHAEFGCYVEVYAPYTPSTSPVRLVTPTALFTLVEGVTEALVPLLAVEALGPEVGQVEHESTSVEPWADGSLTYAVIALKADGPDPLSLNPC